MTNSEHLTRARRIFCGLPFILLVCFCLAALASCGKKGDPKPRQASRSFVWQEVSITPASGCLDVMATMSGVYTNLDSIILELAPVKGAEDCPGCPFQPTEHYKQDNLSKAFNPQSGVLHLTYCPRVKAPAYRARIVGTNVFDTSRHAVSAESLVIMR